MRVWDQTFESKCASTICRLCTGEGIPCWLSPILFLSPQSIYDTSFFMLLSCFHCDIIILINLKRTVGGISSIKIWVENSSFWISRECLQKFCSDSCFCIMIRMSKGGRSLGRRHMWSAWLYLPTWKKKVIGMQSTAGAWTPLLSYMQHVLKKSLYHRRIHISLQLY